MELRKTACVIGFYSYPNVPPSADVFKAFNATIQDTFHTVGVVTTYFGALGAGYSDKYTKVTGRAYKKLLASEFSGIHGLSLVANPASSDAPSYDGFAMASMGYSEASGELLLCVVVNEAFVEFGSDALEGLILQLTKLFDWDFGYSYVEDASSEPELYVMGMDNGRLPNDTYNLLTAWYAATGEERRTRLRDIYSLNFINDLQLSAEVERGISLRNIIENDAHSTLSAIAGTKLYKWVIDGRGWNALRDRLRASQLVLNASR